MATIGPANAEHRGIEMPNPEIELALLKQTVTTLTSTVSTLQDSVKVMEDLDKRRIRAGIVLLGTGILGLFGTISALIVYIWKTIVGG